MGIFAPFSNSIRLLKLGQDDMATKRKTITLRNGDVIDVAEFHDGNYGAPGQPRLKKKKATPEQMEKVNRLNKVRTCRLRLLAYINYDDYFGTWTYKKSARPDNMIMALANFQKAKRKVQLYFKKMGYELYWFRNIEEGTRGAWHIHFVMNKIQGAAEVITKSWEHGGVYLVQIKESGFYDEDFTKLANYMTKDEGTVEYNKDGTVAKPRIKKASYNTSRNMPLPEPKVDKLVRWKRDVKPKKGYYIASIHEGINPATGYMYRRYTMIRIRGDDG